MQGRVRAEDQEASISENADIAIVIPHRKQCRSFLAPRSVYCDIGLQYRVHNGADVGKKTDIGEVKKRVYTDVTPQTILIFRECALFYRTLNPKP
jgi:hypothetical protein